MKSLNTVKMQIKVTLVCAMALAGAVGTLWAEDIDLFTSISPGGSNPPTVLIAWHSSGNANANVVHGCTYDDDSSAPDMGDTTGGMEQCAMVNTLLAIKSDAALIGKVKVGLMMFNETAFGDFDNGTDLGNGNDRCGFLVSPPALMDVDGIDAMIARLKSLTTNDLANQSRLGDMMAETWAMLNGLSSSCSGVNYSTLAEVATACRDAVVVYLGNATKETATVSDGNEDPESLLKTELTSAFSYATDSDQYEYFTTPISVTSLNNSDSDNNSYWGDEWSRFMHRANIEDSTQSDRNITTYSIAVYDPDLSAKLAGEINFYSEMAKQGGGKSFLVEYDDAATLKDVLYQIFNEVQDVNSVFASATLPVSANTQGTYLNQIFIAMFRPDPQAKPRWYGNLKQYQLGFDAGGNIVLTDSTIDPATQVAESVTNPITGTVAASAISFWTTNSPGVTGWPIDGYWRNSPEGEGFAFDSPDGDLVQKGGAAQMLRVDNLTATYTGSDMNSRTLYTCNNIGSCTSTMPEFDTSNGSLNTTLFGVSTSSQLSGVSMAAGKGAFKGLVTSCDSSGAVKNRRCHIKYLAAGATLSEGDVVFTTDCDTNDCVVDNLGSIDPGTGYITFDYPVQNWSVNQEVAFYIGSTSINATAPSAHGLADGDTVVLSACTGRSDAGVYGLDETGGLPQSPFTREVTVTSVSVDGLEFTFDLAVAGYAGVGANVSCTITTGLDADTLIKWVRGEDNAGNEVDPGPCDGVACATPVTIRPSIHGDVLHSRPAVVNYGTGTGVVVFYGANDGVFHAINGNQTGDIGGTRPGGELWGFIAPEFFDEFKRQYQNSPLVDIEGILDPDAVARDYFFDGSTTVFQDGRSNSSTTDKVYIYLTARRGGKLVYALDVTDPTAPKYLWSLSDSNIPELGYTWSQPKIALLEGYTDGNNVPKAVLVMGAGYDPDTQDLEPAGYDPDTNTTSSDDEGRGIVILDAVTGEVLWAALADCTGVAVKNDADFSGACVTVADLDYSVAADITLIDSDYDGTVDRLYAADVGGNIWRVNIGSTTVADWEIYKLASLGGSGNDARKFLFAPDVIITGNFSVVVAVSGDREHPLYTDQTTAGLAYNVQDRFYVIQDLGDGNTITESDLFDNPYGQCYDSTTFAGATCGTEGAVEVTFGQVNGTKRGYYMDLPGQGEKGVNAPLAVAGKVYFGTNQPDVPTEGSCSANLGIARAYLIDFRTGTSESRVFSGGGLPPSPIAGLVTIGDQTVPFIIGGQGPSPFDPGEPEIEVSGKRNRAYWYYE